MWWEWVVVSMTICTYGGVECSKTVLYGRKRKFRRKNNKNATQQNKQMDLRNGTCSETQSENSLKTESTKSKEHKR